MEEKEVKKNWTARSVRNPGSAHNARLVGSSKLSAMSRSVRNPRSTREGPQGDAQCALSMQRHAEREVSMKNKLLQAYKRSMKLNEKTYRIS